MKELAQSERSRAVNSVSWRLWSIVGSGQKLAFAALNYSWKASINSVKASESYFQGSHLLCRYELLPWLGLKLQMQLAEEKGMSQVMLDGEFKVNFLMIIVFCHTRCYCQKYLG